MKIIKCSNTYDANGSLMSTPEEPFPSKMVFLEKNETHYICYEEGDTIPEKANTIKSLFTFDIANNKSF